MSTDPWSLSTTAASNTTIGGVSAAEGILPANLNNIDRALAAGLAEMVNVNSGAIAAGGTGDAITVTTGLSWASYAAGKWVAFKATATNTTAVTLAVDGLAAKDVKDNTGTALGAGAIVSGGIYHVYYQAAADNFRLAIPSTGPATGVSAAAVVTDNRIVRGDGGARGIQESLIVIDDTTGTTYPSANDSGSIGKSGNAWSDAFWATGAVINFGAGNYTVTHSSGLLTYSGAVTIGGALTISGAGAGQIVFPATQNASANANTLDDYEEGTWTPTLTFGGSSTGVTYSTQTGTYTKIGNMVFFSFSITLTSNGSGTGQATLGAMPFANGGVGMMSMKYYSNLSSVTGAIGLDFQTGTLTGNLWQTGSTVVTSLTDTNIPDTAVLIGAGVYTL